MEKEGTKSPKEAIANQIAYVLLIILFELVFILFLILAVVGDPSGYVFVPLAVLASGATVGWAETTLTNDSHSMLKFAILSVFSFTIYPIYYIIIRRHHWLWFLRKQRLTRIPEVYQIKHQLEDNIQSMEKNNLDYKKKTIKDVQSGISERIEYADQHGLNAVQNILTNFNKVAVESIECIEQEKHRRDLKNKIETIDSKLKNVNRLIDKGEIKRAETQISEIDSDFETAKTEIEQIASDVESVEATIDEYESKDFEHLRSNLSNLKQKREDLLDEINEIRREQRHQNLEDELDTLRSKLDDIEALAEEGPFDEAQTKVNAIASKIRSTKRKAQNNEFHDLQSEAEALEEQRQTILQKVPIRLKGGTIPDGIPEAPNISVNYNDLMNKEPIGGGGNADVTKATMPTPDGDVTVAIKEPRMAGTLQMDAVDQMLEEAKTWDKLDDHDHIVSVLDYGDVPIPWIAMEYMDGGHLGSKGGVLDMAQALWTAIAITKGVRHAHRRGVAHLDLKPENVLFRPVEDGWDAPKVADWGLSKHLLEHSKSVEGLSPQYAAPEQFDDGYGSADDITDIYQLGAVFYELFTGQPPFDGKPAQAMHKVLHEEPIAPSELADVHEELDEILLTALAKEKGDRYDDILYLRDELQELFDN